MDNWLYYIVIAGFFAISKVMENRRKQEKKDGRTMVPPSQNDTNRPSQKTRRNKPNNSPDSLDEVLAEMLGIPKQVKPVKEEPTKIPTSNSKAKTLIPKRIPTAPPQSSAPIVGSKEKETAQSQPVKEQETLAFDSYTKPKSVSGQQSTVSNQGSSTKKRPVNLRQAVIYQTILERKYS